MFHVNVYVLFSLYFNYFFIYVFFLLIGDMEVGRAAGRGRGWRKKNGCHCTDHTMFGCGTKSKGIDGTSCLSV